MANDAARQKDEIGPWGKIKGEIISKYAHAYTTIMRKQKWCRGTVYVDAFAGNASNTVRGTGELVPGSAALALRVDPPFSEYHFIDIDDVRVQSLRLISEGRVDVEVHHGDGNRILQDSVIPRLRNEQRRRGLVVLDPYGLQLDWSVMKSLGETRSAEIVLNFPTMDINRNALRNNPGAVLESSIRRMTTWWGDESWRTESYAPSPQKGLWDEPATIKTVNNEDVVRSYCRRLKEVAGFGYVAKPFAVRNSTNAVMYYLVFASPNSTGAKIMGEILDRYR